MGSFGWGDLIAVVAVLVSLASVAVTVRTSRDAEAAAAAAAKRQEHMARAFDRLVAAAERIAAASGKRHDGSVRADDPAAAQWQVENPSQGRFLLRNLSPSTRHDVRIDLDPAGRSGGDPSDPVDLAPLGTHAFMLGQGPGEAGPERILVTDAEHPTPVEVPVARWF